MCPHGSPPLWIIRPDLTTVPGPAQDGQSAEGGDLPAGDVHNGGPETCGLGAAVTTRSPLGRMAHRRRLWSGRPDYQRPRNASVASCAASFTFSPASLNFDFVWSAAPSASMSLLSVARPTFSLAVPLTSSALFLILSSRPIWNFP